MLKIRFQRTGRKNDPAYRMVVTEHTASPRAGKHVATVGSYHPKTKETIIDAEAVKKWMGHGAKASGTVHNLLITQGVIEGEKVNVLSKKTPIVKEKEKEEPVEEKAEESTEAPTEEEVEAEVEEEKNEAEGASNDEVPAEEPKAEESTTEEPTSEEEKKEDAA